MNCFLSELLITLIEMDGACQFHAYGFWEAI